MWLRQMGSVCVQGWLGSAFVSQRQREEDEKWWQQNKYAKEEESDPGTGAVGWGLMLWISLLQFVSSLGCFFPVAFLMCGLHSAELVSSFSSGCKEVFWLHIPLLQGSWMIFLWGFWTTWNTELRRMHLQSFRFHLNLQGLSCTGLPCNLENLW